MKWFLVVMACTNCNVGVDPGMIQGWSAAYTQVAKVEMPTLATCQQVRTLNANSECWGKEDDKK